MDCKKCDWKAMFCPLLIDGKEYCPIEDKDNIPEIKAKVEACDIGKHYGDCSIYCSDICDCGELRRLIIKANCDEENDDLWIAWAKHTGAVEESYNSTRNKALREHEEKQKEEVKYTRGPAHNAYGYG